jgi:DNA-binding CsgD family transcriptional regulator/tetratricopeptide (TPR) repeat protein
MSPLLERESFLAAFSEEFAAAGAGSGRILLVAGEAGIGKTSLVECIAAGLPAEQVLWGNCEALLTPQPLGPLHDISRDSWANLRPLFDSGADRPALFSGILDALIGSAQPMLMVLEDVHWADAATLDLIKFIGRRIHRTRTLLALTYRDDEITPTHPLRAVLGDLPPRHVRRLQLPRFSQPLVDALAAASSNGYPGLYAATGGNPFFVTEVLADGSAAVPSAVPATIRDAVLGRATRLGASARAVLELVCLMPTSADLSVIHAVAQPLPATIDECISGGLLILENHALRFRHELARVAVEGAMAPAQRRQGHARVLAVLENAVPVPPLARLAHHAFLADDATAVLRLSPLAAREAMARGARREAAAHCRAMLTFASALTDALRAQILDEYAWHCFELNDYGTAMTASGEAIALFSAMNDPARQSAALSLQARILVRSLRNTEADQACQRAIDLLTPLAPCPELARAYATWSYLRMLDRDYRQAIEWGDKAIVLALRFDDRVILAAAHNAVGAAQLFVDYAAGCDSILKSMALAAKLDDGGAAMADAYVMLGCGSGEVFQFPQAERYLAEGIEFSRLRDLDRFSGYMEASQAVVDVYRGRWDAAGMQASVLVARENFGSTNRVAALVALGRLRTRRGDPGAREVLDEALALAEQSGTLQRIAPVRCIRAEAAWLAGDMVAARDEALAAFGLVQTKGHEWFLGELAYWLWRVGHLQKAPARCAAPYVAQIEGRWLDAAAAWNRLGCPYERARALADGDEPAQREALQAFEALGAEPMARWLRQRMRSVGVRAVPRGPRASTRANPSGLTARELQVLALIAEGLHNGEVATKLSRSPRTIDHHVAGIYAKLGVNSRVGAAKAASDLGLLNPK